MVTEHCKMQSADLSWPGLILLSYTTGPLTEGQCRLYVSLPGSYQMCLLLLLHMTSLCNRNTVMSLQSWALSGFAVCIIFWCKLQHMARVSWIMWIMQSCGTFAGDWRALKQWSANAQVCSVVRACCPVGQEVLCSHRHLPLPGHLSTEHSWVGAVTVSWPVSWR